MLKKILGFFQLPFVQSAPVRIEQIEDTGERVMIVMDSRFPPRLAWNYHTGVGLAEAERVAGSVLKQGGLLFKLDAENDGDGNDLLKKFDPKENMVLAPLIIAG